MDDGGPDAGCAGTDAAHIAARLERLPLSPWHVKVRVFMGVATFFDAFDSLTIAYALPVLIGNWHLAPRQVGALLAVGFVGQAIGALLFGWLAERWGRIAATRMTVALFAIMSFVCATAQSYDQLFWYRFVQGIGLGGQVPIATAYISEIARSDRRGRFFSLYEIVFPLGLLVSGLAGAWIVPRFGWPWLFVVGGLPALLAPILQRVCPESPRWLASKGRLREADEVLRRIEAIISRNGASPLPEPKPTPSAPKPEQPTRWTELFSSHYRKRTLVVWVLFACSYLVSFGLVVWQPTLYRTEFHLSVQQALNYSMVTNLAGLAGSVTCALTIDVLGRRRLFVCAFMLACLALFVLWLTGAAVLIEFVVLTGIAYFAIYAVNNGIYLYTAEIYPTRLRAIGVGVASFWLRFSSVIGPYVVGWILPLAGIRGILLFFTVVALVGCITAAWGAIETRGQVLERLSP